MEVSDGGSLVLMNIFSFLLFRWVIYLCVDIFSGEVGWCGSYNKAKPSFSMGD